MAVLQDFIDTHVDGGKAGSLYISGPPGTGKTAVLSRTISTLQVSVAFSASNSYKQTNRNHPRKTRTFWGKMAASVLVLFVTKFSSLCDVQVRAEHLAVATGGSHVGIFGQNVSNHPLPLPM